LVVGTVACAPGLNAGFVSDDYGFLRTAATTSLSRQLGSFMPSAATFYRPLGDLLFWVEYHLFGYHALPYHVVAFGFHIASVILLLLLVRRLAGGWLAAVVAAYVFLTTIHLHEVIWWMADYHYAPVTALLLGTTLAHACDRRGLAFALGSAGLFTSEPGILVVPILALYESIYRVDWQRRRTWIECVRRLLPLMIVTIAYVGLRVGVAGGRFHNETVPCRGVRCLATGAMDYLNRLVLRPNRLISLDTSHRTTIALLIVLAGVLLAVVLRPWAWSTWPAVLFALSWIALSSLLFIVTLWPYSSDRFLYLPDAGLAILLGVAAAQCWRLINEGAGLHRLGPIAVLGGVAVWMALAPPMLWSRAQLWNAAGDEVRSIIESTVRTVPDPPRGTILLFHRVPDSYAQQIPPGNTGPYVFRNDLDAAILHRYGRADLTVLTDRRGNAVPAGSTILQLTISDGRVRQGS